MTVSAGSAFRARLFRWTMLIGALVAVTLFGGPSCADDPHAPALTGGYAACPTILLQASMLGDRPAGDDGATPVGGHAVAVTDTGLFVVGTPVGPAMLGAALRPLPIDLLHRWAAPTLSRPWLPAVTPIRTDALRI